MLPQQVEQKLFSSGNVSILQDFKKAISNSNDSKAFNASVQAVMDHLTRQLKSMPTAQAQDKHLDTIKEFIVVLSDFVTPTGTHVTAFFRYLIANLMNGANFNLCCFFLETLHMMKSDDKNESEVRLRLLSFMFQ